MRAIVTGGAGFIGSHVVDALVARGDDVVVVDNLATGRRENLAKEARLEELDIRDERLAELFADVRPEVCFHLAAQADVSTSVERPVYDAEVKDPEGRRPFSGTPEQVLEDVETYGKLGVSELMFDFRSERLQDSLERMERFAALVRPRRD